MQISAELIAAHRAIEKLRAEKKLFINHCAKMKAEIDQAEATQRELALRIQAIEQQLVTDDVMRAAVGELSALNVADQPSMLGEKQRAKIERELTELRACYADSEKKIVGQRHAHSELDCQVQLADDKIYALAKIFERYWYELTASLHEELRIDIGKMPLPLVLRKWAAMDVAVRALSLAEFAKFEIVGQKWEKNGAVPWAWQKRGRFDADPNAVENYAKTWGNFPELVALHSQLAPLATTYTWLQQLTRLVRDDRYGRMRDGDRAAWESRWDKEAEALLAGAA